MESSNQPGDLPEETGALIDVGELRVAAEGSDHFSVWEFCKCDEIFKILTILALECAIRVLKPTSSWGGKSEYAKEAKSRVPGL